MSKILIFSASTGGGHNSAAKSLKMKFESCNHDIKIIDILKLRNKIIESLISEGYEILSCNLPLVYRELYNYSNNKVVNKKLSMAISRIFTRKILAIINDEKADLIIGTHAFTIKPVEKLKKKGKINIPYISIVTDFKAHRTYISNYVDAYVTGSEYTKNDLVSKGIDKNIIYSYGIPVRNEFMTKRITNKDKNDFNILIMGGSMGVKGIEPLLDRILLCNNKLNLRVVCGNNKNLYNKLGDIYEEKFISDGHRIEIHGFTNRISEFMDDADILISKPGGLTVSESFAKELPMIIPFMIPGQEEENADFLESSGAALIGNEDINIILDKIIENNDILEDMRKNIREITKNYSINNIEKLGEKLIHEYGKVVLVE